jgi:hypothetical protein
MHMLLCLICFVLQMFFVFFTEIGFMKRFVVVNSAASFLYAVVGTSVFNFKYTFPRDKNPPADE